MIIYEVNLIIQPQIWSQYTTWLAKHIEEILLIKGFEWADIFQILEPEADQAGQICVQYHLTNHKALKLYTKQHAAEMRQQAIDLFGDQFSASRRVLQAISAQQLIDL